MVNGIKKIGKLQINDLTDVSLISYMLNDMLSKYQLSGGFDHESDRSPAMSYFIGTTSRRILVGYFDDEMDELIIKITMMKFIVDLPELLSSGSRYRVFASKRKSIRIEERFGCFYSSRVIDMDTKHEICNLSENDIKHHLHELHSMISIIKNINTNLYVPH